MGVYARCLFPRFMDWTLGGRMFARERAEVLAPVQGDVLEVGFGTGLNLAHYPARVRRLIALDNADHLPKRVNQRIAAVPFAVERVCLEAERIPFPDARFDWVVSTWTLCSIADPVTALHEMRRVLRDDGAYVFLEHGRSDDPRVAAWQDWFNPIQRRIGCGCNINRPIDALIREAGFTLARLDRYVLPKSPRMMASMYRGRAAPGPIVEGLAALGTAARA